MTFFEAVFSLGDLDRAQTALYLSGCGGVSERFEAQLPVAAAYFADRGRAEQASKMLRDAGILNRVIEVLAGDDPMAGFRAAARPFVIGPFHLDPRDESAEPADRIPGLKYLRVPASCAFGTGLHESTAGILRSLGASPPVGKSVLDVGCGSGILAIAAAALGADFCCAFDLDPDAVFEAKKNLARNPSIVRVAIFTGSIDAVERRFDLVLANMIFEELSPLLPSIFRRIAPGGRAIFAGLLDEKSETAAAALEALELSVSKRESDGTWSVLEAQK